MVTGVDLTSNVTAFAKVYNNRSEIRDNQTTKNTQILTDLEGIPDPFFFYQTAQFIVLIVLFLLIVIGNLLVLISMIRSKSPKSRMNFFIMHLAFADLLVGIINVLVDIIWRITITWPAGNIACKITRYSQVLVTYSSTYMLVSLSIDRYDAITHPMKFSGSRRRAKTLVASAWIISAIFSLPIPFLYEVTKIRDREQCWLDFPSELHWRVYMTSAAILVFVIPALIIIACYSIIVYTIWKKSESMMKRNGYHSRASRGRSSRKWYVSDVDEPRRASSRGLIPRAKIKTIKMTFVIVIVFIVCWSPYFVFDLLQVYGYIPRTQTSVAIATFVQSLATLNSAANPLIYCLFSTRTGSTLWKKPPLRWIRCCLNGCFPTGTKRTEAPRPRRHAYDSGMAEMSCSGATDTITFTSRKSASRPHANPSSRLFFFRTTSADPSGMKNSNGNAQTAV